MKTATPGVPTNSGAIKRIRATTFPNNEPKENATHAFGIQLHIVVDANQEVSEGGLLNVAPGEYYEAALCCVGDLLDMQRTPAIERKLKAFLFAFKSAVVNIEVVPSANAGARYFLATNLRNQFEEKHQETKRSARQDVFSIMAFRCAMNVS